MENKKRYILMGIVMMILVISVGTYAWLSYRSSDTAMVLTIGEVGSINITLSPYKFNSSIDPTITYEGNDYVSVTAKNDSSNAYKIKLYYKINDIPEELIDSTFKYTILRSTDGESYEEYDDGNFSNAASGSEYIILDEEKIKSGEVKYYRVYLWIEGSVTDNTGMQGKIFNAELRADYERVDGIESVTYEEISNNYSCLVDGETYSVGDPIFTYTGECEVVDDSDGNWKVRFLSDGTFITTEDMIIDAFLVGGGGGGATGSTLYSGGGGGAGGYTNQTTTFVKKEQNYDIKIGAGGTAATDGEDTTAFGAIASGGSSGFGIRGGTGGSGGGDGQWSNNSTQEFRGGSDGSNGESRVAGVGGGNGQETTTCEFGINNCTTELLYSGGGGGGKGINANDIYGIGGIGGIGGGADACQSALDNTGGGGGGGGAKSGCTAGGGGSGIVIIRNVRGDESIDELPSVGFDFEYTGNYIIINDGSDNWRIKFLTSGIFTSTSDLEIDAFLVGGGGGGGNGDSLYTGGGGGGSGYTLTITKINIEKNKDYDIIIGTGGTSNNDGTSTIAFEQEAAGGSKGIIGGQGSSNGGGSGGSGGSGGGKGQWSNNGTIGDGGSNGSNGEPEIDGLGGTGQGSTTCEFGIDNCDLELFYAGGGGGGAGKSAEKIEGIEGSGGSRGGGNGGSSGGSTYTYTNGSHAVTNTGSGGGGGGVKGSYDSSVAGVGGSGGSGIVVIRNAR